VDGDIVVVAVPLKAYRQVPAEPVAGKVVIDTTNYLPRPAIERARLLTSSSSPAASPACPTPSSPERPSAPAPWAC